MKKEKTRKLGYVRRPNGWLTFVAYLIPAIAYTTIFWWLYDIATVCYYLDSFLYSFRHLFEAIICIFITYLTLKSQIKFLGVILCIQLANDDIKSIEKIGYGFAVDGEQNAGKSFMLGYIASVLEPVRFDDLLIDYFVDYSYKTKLKESFLKGYTLSYKLFQMRSDAVKFYRKNENYIPLLYSSNGLQLHGKESQALLREHLTGEVRQPENSINLHDEIAQMFPNTQRTVADDDNDKHKINALNKNASCERQRYGGINLLGEQRFGEVNLSLRTTSGIRRHLIAREVLYKSKLLGKLIKYISNKILNKEERTSQRLAGLYKWLQRLDMKIGFHCVYFVDGVGPESLAITSSNLKRMILFCDVDFNYAHRYYFSEYEAQDQPLQFSPSVNSVRINKSANVNDVSKK